MVVDEVLGQWVTLLGATRIQLESAARRLRFVPRLRYLEALAGAKFEKLPGGTGIVADDLAAGVYGALILYIGGRFGLY